MGPSHRRTATVVPLGALVLWLAWLLAACGGSAQTISPTTSAGTTAAGTGAATAAGASPSETGPSGTTGATPTGSAMAQVTASPDTFTAAPLQIDGQSVEQVVVPAPGLDIAYAVTGSGLYRHAPGQGWTRVSTDTGDDVHILADPTRPDILYRGDHPPCAQGAGGPSVPFQKSLDGGKTWQTIPGGENIRPMAIDPANIGHLYGEDCAKLAISTDGGQTWSTIQPVAGFDVSSLALVGTQLYGIYTSEGGTSRLVMTDVSNPAQPVTGQPLLQFWGGGVVSASLDRIIVGEPHGVHISSDSGQTWSFSRKGLEQVTTSVDGLTQPIPKAEIARGFDIFAVATDPKHSQRIYVGTIHGLYLSQDDGATWQPVPEVGSDRIRDLDLSMPQSQLYVTTDAGVQVLRYP